MDVLSTLRFCIFQIILLLKIVSVSAITHNPCIELDHSLVAFIRCQSKFYIPEKSITFKDYNDMAVDESYSVMVEYLLNTPCPFAIWPNSPHLTFTIIKESSGRSFCALTERFLNGKTFAKGWAMLVTKSQNQQSILMNRAFHDKVHYKSF